MKKKGNFRKVVSGLLAGMTMLSTVLSPMTAYAAEIQPEEKPPLYEEVKDLLDEDEVVTAKDYEIETGSVFNVKSDYTGLEIKDDNKVKVTFEEAKNDKDEDFTTDHADTYKAVYYVEPVNQEHPKYQISRKLIVREKATEAQTETAGSEAVTESETAGSEQQTEEAEDSEADSEITDIDADEFDDLVEQAQNQDTYDEESGLELHDVLEQAGDEGVDLDAMEEGEIATFEAVSAYSARSTQQVTIEKGPLYRYADYNLGTYLTEPYYISYGNVRAIAYCVQPAKPGPGSGNYTITKIGDNQALAKVCYYGTDAAGSESFFANKHTDFSEGKRFIIIHMAASYANGSSDAFYGTNATGEALAKELYNYCVNKPEIPDVAMSFSKPDVKAYVDRNVQRTENIKFNASSQQKITMDLPKGVKLHNVSTGTVSAAGASVTHVDASKGMVTWAKENAISSGLKDAPIRWLVDDCVKFVEREIRRGNHYDAIIMDPPSYGRGPKGEIWKIEESVYPLIQLCSQILTDNPLFFLINSYTTGLQPAVLSYMISTVLGTANGTVTASEIGLPVSSNGLVLPCGASGRYEATGI